MPVSHQGWLGLQQLGLQQLGLQQLVLQQLGSAMYDDRFNARQAVSVSSDTGHDRSSTDHGGPATGPVSGNAARNSA